MALLLCCLGLIAQPLWSARDPRVATWVAWHDSTASEPLDPWETPFRERADEIRSAGPNRTFDDADDLLVPRVPPSELTLYALLGWLPWVLAAGLVGAWEAARWLRRPTSGRWQDELPLSAAGGLALGFVVGFALDRAASSPGSELMTQLESALVVPPSVALGCTVGGLAGGALLVLRLRSGSEESELEG